MSNHASGKEIWQSYTASNKVYDIAYEGDYIWCATLGGVFCWDRRDGSYTRYTTVDGLADNHVENVLIAPDGTKWFRTLSGVSSFDGIAWNSYSEENGFPHYYVSIMHEQSNGTMWFGTRKGITSFDGSVWMTYMSEEWLEHNDVNCILEDSDGNLWFGTGKGLMKYNGVDWTVYTVDNGLSNNLVRSMLEAEDGSVWIASYRGLTHIYGENIAQYLSDYDISGIAESGNGLMWFGTKDGAYRFDGKEWKLYEGEIDSNLYVDNKNNIWYSSNKTIVSIDDTLMTVYSEEDGLPDADFSSLIPGVAGDLWAITSGRYGIAHFDGTSWKRFDDWFELTYYTPSDIYVDDKGYTWFGMNGCGLWSFNGDEWKQYITDDGPLDSYNEYIMIDSSGSVLCSSGYNYGLGNISGYDGIAWTQKNIGIASYLYEITEAPDGTLWLSIEDGVVSFDGSVSTVYSEDDGLGTGDVHTVFADSKGIIWCGHERGNISRFDGNTWEEIYPDGGGVLESWIYTIEEDRDGNIWVGANNGLGKFDGRKWIFYLPGNGFPVGSGHTAVYNLVQDYDGYIWVATQYGIGRFNGETWTTYTTSYAGGRVNGSTDYVLSCAVDKNNNKWFGTYLGGVIKYDGKTWTNYTTKDGLCSNTVNSIAVGHDGSMWFGTNNGISVLRDEQPTYISSQNPDELHNIIGFYPNPFNSVTTISFSLPSSGFTGLVIYNVMGQKVRTLLAENHSAGNYSVVWDGRDSSGVPVSSGTYITNLKAGSKIWSGKMLLVK